MFLSVKNMILAGVVALVLGMTGPGAAQTEPLAGDLVSGIEARYANKGFCASFDQAARLSALDITEKATGRACFSHPGKMRWLYQSPDQHEIITNGNLLWLYRPEEGQVMIGQAQNFFKPGTGGAFLSDITQIRQDFDITLGQFDEGHAELILVPKQENPDLAQVRITVGLPSHTIQMVETENIYKDTTRFVFTEIRFEVQDSSQFDFQIPDGTSIIEMD